MTSKVLFTILFLFAGFTFIQAQEATASVEGVSTTTEPETAEEEQEEAPGGLEMSGSVDVYYRANLTAKNNSAVSYPVPGSSFANGNGFSLGMFNLITSYSGTKSGIVADLAFGPRGADAVFASAPALNLVNQLYVYWNIGESTTLTFGNFNTFLGYEVISPASNFNYSTSYMFSYGPFSHTGIKADFGLTDKMSLMLGVFNPTDLTDSNPVNTYTLGAQLGYAGDASSIYLNFVYGDQDGTLDEDAITPDEESAGATFQVDLTAGFDLTEDFYLGLNTTFNTTAVGEVAKGTSIEELDGDPSSFYGVAAYLQYAMSDAFALGLRTEYFGEGNGGVGAIGAYDVDSDASIIDITLSGNIKVGSLTLIPEFRVDIGSEEATFVNSKLEPSKSLASFLLAAVYSF